MATSNGNMDSSKYPSGWRLVATLIALTLGTMLVAIDTSVISVATPAISTRFHALQDVGWYGSAYLITLTAFQPISGTIYKSFDPKIAYCIFIIIFEVGSIVCAAAPSSTAFIIGRAVAGIGGAGLLQGALGIITFIAPLDKRPLYMAIVISVFGLFGSVGPIIGGALTDRVTWRWCFWINVPVGGVCAVLVVLFMKLENVDQTLRALPISTKLRKMDPLGIVLLVACVSCLFIALQDGGTVVPWNSSRVIGLFVGFGVIATLFVLLQWKLGLDATIPFKYLTQRTVAFGSVFLFCDNMSNYIKLYYMPFYFQAALGHSAVQSGVDYVSLAAPQFFSLLFGGALINAIGHYMPVVLVGQVFCCVGTGFLTTIRSDTRTALWATYMALTGFGLGLSINAPHIAIQAVMKSEDEVFVANGIATFFSQLGGSLAVSIGNSILTSGLNREIPRLGLSLGPEEVIHAGPLGLEALAENPSILNDLRASYALAVTSVLIFALVIICLSVPAACGMQWLNLKKVAAERKPQSEQSEKSESVGRPSLSEKRQCDDPDVGSTSA